MEHSEPGGLFHCQILGKTAVLTVVIFRIIIRKAVEPGSTTVFRRSQTHKLDPP
jgi:hypothetical protein